MEDIEGSQILILQLCFYNFMSTQWLLCTCHNPVPCDLFSIYLFTSALKSGHFYCLCCSQLQVPAWKALLHFLYHGDSTVLENRPNILVNMVTFDHSVCFSDAIAHVGYDNFNKITLFDYWNGLQIVLFTDMCYCWA